MWNKIENIKGDCVKINKFLTTVSSAVANALSLFQNFQPVSWISIKESCLFPDILWAHSQKIKCSYLDQRRIYCRVPAPRQPSPLRPAAGPGDWALCPEILQQDDVHAQNGNSECISVWKLQPISFVEYWSIILTFNEADETSIIHFN